MSRIFKMDDGAKAMQIDARGPAKTMQIGANLEPK
jgi:hypothetical protein